MDCRSCASPAGKGGPVGGDASNRIECRMRVRAPRLVGMSLWARGGPSGRAAPDRWTGHRKWNGFSSYTHFALRSSTHNMIRRLLDFRLLGQFGHRTPSSPSGLFKHGLVFRGLPDLNVALAHRNQLWMHAIDMEVLHLIPLVVGAEVDEGTVGAGVGRAVMLHRAHQMVLF